MRIYSLICKRDEKERWILKDSNRSWNKFRKRVCYDEGGSITGISTNLEIVRGEGEIEVVIYRNGEAVEFGNSFVGDSEGVKKDYDIQPEGTVKFEAGDVISVTVEANDSVVWKDVITMAEIVTIR